MNNHDKPEGLEYGGTHRAPSKLDLRPDQVVLDLVLSYCTTMPKFGFAAVLGGGDLAGTVPSLILASKNHLGQPTMTGVPIYFDGEPFDGDPAENKPPRFVLRRIGSTVWKVAPSISTPLLHAFITIVNVPEDVPWPVT